MSLQTAEALKEASSRGVKVVIATGKVRNYVILIFYFRTNFYSPCLGTTCLVLMLSSLSLLPSVIQTRPAVINIFKMVNLAGKDGIISEFSPGVFVQV